MSGVSEVSRSVGSGRLAVVLVGGDLDLASVSDLEPTWGEFSSSVEVVLHLSGIELIEAVGFWAPLAILLDGDDRRFVLAAPGERMRRLVPQHSSGDEFASLDGGEAY